MGVSSILFYSIWNESISLKKVDYLSSKVVWLYRFNPYARCVCLCLCLFLPFMLFLLSYAFVFGRILFLSLMIKAHMHCFMVYLSSNYLYALLYEIYGLNIACVLLVTTYILAKSLMLVNCWHYARIFVACTIGDMMHNTHPHQTDVSSCMSFKIVGKEH